MSRMSRRSFQRIPLQGRRGDSQFPHMDRYSCSACQIDYHLPQGQSASCPLCTAGKMMDAMGQEIESLKNANSLLKQDLERLEVQVNSLTAMKHALELMSDEDMQNVKSVAYQWRADRASLAMQPMFEIADGARTVTGFIIRPRGQVAEGYRCTSVGGVALASCYAETYKMAGSVKAMELLLRALAWRLSGGT